MSNMVCTQCGFQNDPTRVFCQNCGTRLTVSPGTGAAPVAGKLFVPQQQTAAPNIAPQGYTPPQNYTQTFAPPGKRAPVRQAGPSIFSLFFRGLISTAILGAVLAVVVQMARPPEGIPVAKTASVVQADALYTAIKSTSGSPYVRSLALYQDQINNFLAAKIVAVQPEKEMALQAQFSRAFVVLNQGQGRVYIEQRLMKWPIYMYLIKTSGGPGEVIKTAGGGVGRMPFHPLLVPLIERVMASPLAAIGDAAQGAGKPASVSFSAGLVTLNWAGAGSPHTP